MRTRAQGFTILETVIAMLILTFIIFSLGILIPLSQTRIRTTSHRDMAFTIADAVLEQMQTIYWDRIRKNSTYIGNSRFFDSDNQSIAEDSYDTPVNGYPPSPYPTVSHNFNSAENHGSGFVITPHLVRYVIVVRSLYSNPSEENMVTVSVDVYWKEQSTGKNRDSGLKKITVSTMRYQRDEE
ncbi:MAG: hypothetical protein AB9903_31495 [Vulcanimicrobiota bacterium]